jgi:hypothetical protein
MRFLSSLLLYAALANVVHTLPVPREAANHATQNSTHIFFLLDRSGSMETIRDDVIGGYNRCDAARGIQAEARTEVSDAVFVLRCYSYVKAQQTQTGAGDLYMSLYVRPVGSRSCQHPTYSMQHAPTLPSNCRIQFDGQEPHEKIFTSKPIAETPMLDRAGFQPRGSTPLFDAIGCVCACLWTTATPGRTS